jgi:predicted dehydrogenase
MNAHLRVAMIGTGFMGRAHSHAWNLARNQRADVSVELAVVVGTSALRTASFAAERGWAESSASWRDVVTRADIDVIDVCVPPHLHAEIASLALANGKHVLCEKPLTAGLDESRRLAELAAQARDEGTFAMVGFNYRSVPAVALAKSMIASGSLGEILEMRTSYLQDMLSDPDAPATWRLLASEAGSGALADLGSHLVDLVHFLLSDRIAGLSALLTTTTSERGWVDDPSRRVAITVDDTASVLARTEAGIPVTIQASRVATGRKNALQFEISGTLGTVRFDLERLNELHYFDARAPVERAGFTRVLVTETSHPHLRAWWPAGHVLGWDHAMVIQAGLLIDAIVSGVPPRPDFDDGLAVQEVLDAAARSFGDGEPRWMTVTGPLRGADAPLSGVPS